MPEYLVIVESKALYPIIVEADNEADAKKQAEDTEIDYLSPISNSLTAKKITLVDVTSATYKYMKGIK